MSRGKILVVDDIASFRLVLGDALIAKGYEILYAANGLDAVKMIKAEISSLDLVVLDLLMPKMNGFEVLKEIRKMDGGEDLPVIIITGLFKNMEDKKQARDLGALAFIDKHIGIENTVSHIDDHLHPVWEDSINRQIAASLLVTYKIGEKPFSAYTYTVGEDGMFIQTSQLSAPGAEAHVRFRLDDEESETITVAGKVISVMSGTEHCGKKKMPPGIVVEFKEISPENKAAIKAWMEKKAATNGSSKSS
jgi:CheY-like chemotaxis protein